MNDFCCLKTGSGRKKASGTPLPKLTLEGRRGRGRGGGWLAWSDSIGAFSRKKVESGEISN